MRKPMGYRNAEAVYHQSHAGRLLKPRGGQVALDTTALNMLTYMALNSYDWPISIDMRRKFIPARCYARGWDKMAEDFGMLIVGGDRLAKIGLDGEALQAAMSSRRNTARARLSQTAKFLQAQGLIKQLLPADVRREKPAVWLLTIGDDEENAKVEDWARTCYGLRPIPAHFLPTKSDENHRKTP